MNTHSPLTKSNKESKILCINFNQDQGCFAIGHENGFLVYNTNPIDLRVKRTFTHPNGHYGSENNTTASGSGIGHITMLHRTNYLALVGGGKNPKFANNKLIIWDDLKRKNSLHLEFMSPVLNVLLSRIRIIVVLKNQVMVYGFSAPPKKFATYETIDNDLGLADLSVNSSSSTLLASSINGGTSPQFPATTSQIPKDSNKYQTLAFPGRQVGQIQLVDVSPQGQEKNLVSIIKAHKSRIRCLALNRSGTLIASASETGTIIRVHLTHNSGLLYEFRRGIDKAIITSMKFSHNDSKLAVLSDKNTLHIFNLTDAATSASVAASNQVSNALGRSNSFPMNKRHLLRNLPIPIPVPNYFNSTWSFCSVNTNKYHTDLTNSNTFYGNSNSTSASDVGVIGWSGNDSVIIIWKNKRIWERYVIVENSTPQPGSYEEGYTKPASSSWELVRYSWKSMDSLYE